jgi:argininosuccinate lyase
MPFKSILKQVNLNGASDLEDVHMNIEARLTDRIGIAGKKLHTGRSRNDQVATDIRLYLRDEIDVTRHILQRLQHGLLDLAEREAAPLWQVLPIYKPHNLSLLAIIY